MNLKQISLLYLVAAAIMYIMHLVLRTQRMRNREIETLADTDHMIYSEVLDLKEKVSKFESQRNPGTERLQTEAHN